MTDPVISVIIPVYNVGSYLDACMQSVLSQTFPDFEILLINDGSTDGSAARCREWALKDGRIRLIEKENEGVSASRNLGIDLARGAFLAFLDPDDWIDSCYLEKLYAAAEESGAPFAECDLWRYDNRTGKKIYRACYGRMGVPYTLREHMKYGPTATYKALSRRSLWTDGGVRMPDCDFESPAVYALILALAGKVASVPEPLYYYRRFRENSLIETGYMTRDGKANNRLGIDAMRFLLESFRRTGLEREYADTLPGVVFYRLNDILAMQYHRKSPEDFGSLVANQRTFLGEVFPEHRNPVYMTWGGYNLSKILSHLEMTHDPSLRFGFSEIMSVTLPPAEGLEIGHRNAYRRIMLEKEASRAFWTQIEKVQPEILFMDLLEERFGSVMIGGSVMTRSDAFEGSTLADADFTEISRDESGERWKQSAEQFVQRIRSVSPGTRFFVVENYLTREAGTLREKEPFPNQEEIRETNRKLKGYYDWFRTAVPDALWLDPSQDPLYFTDSCYEYGAVASHLNALENEKIAGRIACMLKNEEERKNV